LSPRRCPGRRASATPSRPARPRRSRPARARGRAGDARRRPPAAARLAPGGRAALRGLALHGLADHGGNYLAEGGPLLAAGGALVYAYDQRGFGWNVGRGYWPGTETLVEDARAATALIAARHPGLPLFLLGESMGAAVALLADPPGLDGMVLTAPALWGRRYMPWLMRWPLEAAIHLMPVLALPNSVGGIRPTDDPEALRRLGRDPLTLREVRIDMAHGLVDLMDAAVAALPGCCRAAPTLVMLGGKDMVVPTEVSRRALREAAVPRVARYPEGWHLLLRDRIRTEIVRDILAFMADPARPLPAEAEGRRWLGEVPP
jgi:alpha-beta hydrolase superfamily lysophospholipase